MRLLTVPDIILLHKKLIEQTGGSHGIRDASLIESAANRALTTFDGQDLYTTLDSKIAAITYSLVSNHGFVDGNKRVGIAAMQMCSHFCERARFYLSVNIRQERI